MTVWVVRAGSDGGNEDLALSKKIVTIGWSETGNLATIDRATLRAILDAKHPGAKPSRIANWTGQVWAFARTIAKGDLVILPLKRRSSIAFGRVLSDYEYRAEYLDIDAAHTRRVEWLKTDVPRTAVDQDLLFSLGAFLTVFRVERNNAVARLTAIAGASTAASIGTSTSNALDVGATTGEAADSTPDLERTARDLIAQLIGSRFKGHDLERLVEAVLIADGFRVDRTRAGADGGVDLLAGRGELGFDPPRICVQVKSGNVPQDVKPVRELQGALKNFGAEHAVFVSWSGYTTAVYAEARRAYFQVRLWDADDLINAILRSYDSLSPEIRAELPLKRIWAPASGDDGR